jgi:diacylglycerol kinase family enzyme
VKDVYAIINPVSGRRNLGEFLPAIRSALAREGVGLTCRVTAGHGDAARLAEAVPDSARAILVVGGDGTVRDVAGARVGRPGPLAILGGGTENIVAKALRMPRDPEQIAGLILHGRPQPMDVGVVNGRKFLIITGVGFDAEVVHRLHAVRAGHISHFDYFWPIWRTFWAHTFPPVRVDVDGIRVFEGRGLVFVGVLRRYSLGLQLLARAVHDDGLLDVCVYPCGSRSGLLRHAMQTLFRKHVTTGDAIYLHGRHVDITSDVPVPLQIDGDVGDTLPARLGIIPQGVAFLV